MFQTLPLFLREEGRTFQVSTHTPMQEDAVTVKPGEAHRILDMKGPAIIQNIWFTLSSSDLHYLRKISLKVYWDNEEYPSIDVPFGDFFGNGFGIRTPYISQYIGVTSGGFYCYFPMPFRCHMRFEILNETSLDCTVFYHILGQKVSSLPEDTLYFHSSWRRENPTLINIPFTILEAEGKGYYAGVQLFMQAYNEADKMNFLEGDEWIYIDDEVEASIKGTGTEDYFQGGWYFIDGPFHAPYHGMILMDWGKSRVSCYRLHILDRVHFDKKIKVQIEHGQRVYNEARTDYSCVAYWYQNEPHVKLPVLPEPEARERIEPDPAYKIPGAIEFEELKEGTPYYMSTYQEGWSNNMARHFNFQKEGDSINHSFSVAESRNYEISVNYIVNDCNAILQLHIDGEKVGRPVDTYSDDPKDDYLLCRNKAKGLLKLGTRFFEAGSHQIRIEAVGRNVKAKALEAIIDCVVVS